MMIECWWFCQMLEMNACVIGILAWISLSVWSLSIIFVWRIYLLFLFTDFCFLVIEKSPINNVLHLFHFVDFQIESHGREGFFQILNVTNDHGLHELSHLALAYPLRSHLTVTFFLEDTSSRDFPLFQNYCNFYSFTAFLIYCRNCFHVIDRVYIF